MDQKKLRRCKNLIINLREDGCARVWRKGAQDNFELSAAAFRLLFAFTEPATPGEAAAAAGWSERGSLAETLAHFETHGLLVAADAPQVDEAREAPRPAHVATDTSFAGLVDPGSLAEDVARVRGTLTAMASIDGRPVMFVASDGATGNPTLNLEKVLKAQEKALKLRCPMVWVCTEISTAARDEGPPDFDVLDETPYFCGPRGMGRIYSNQVKLSGVAPQLTILLGEALMPVAFPAALGDGLVMLDSSFMALGPPDMVAHFLGEEVSREDLGGARMHCSVSGTGDEVVKSTAEAFAWAKRFLSYLPSHSGEAAPVTKAVAPDSAIDGVIPADGDVPFDMMPAIRAIVDGDSVLQMKRKYAQEIITAFARIDGRPVGIVASNSRYGGGIMRVESCSKASRFISLCDAFNVPLLFLADVPGFLIGSRSEQQGIVRAAAKLFSAICQATVPKLSVIVRKAHTGALYAMCGPPFDPDAFLALSGASLSVFGHKGELELATEMNADADALNALRMPAAVEPVLDAVVAPAELRAELTRRLGRIVVPVSPFPRKRFVSPM